MMLALATAPVMAAGDGLGWRGTMLAGNASPRELAEAVEREQRAWLRSLIARVRDPADLLPDAGEDLP